MSHNLQAFITKESHLRADVRRVQLPQGFALVPMDEFFIGQFPELSTGTKGFSDELCGGHPAVAVFTDYFFGVGEQSAEFSDGTWEREDAAIDVMLNRLGVEKTDSDEFDAIGLGGFRDTFEVLGRPRDLSSISEEEARELCEALGKKFWGYKYEADNITVLTMDGVEGFTIDQTGSVYTQEESKKIIDMRTRMNDIIMEVTSKVEGEERETEVQRIVDERSGRSNRNRIVQEFLSRKNFYIQPAVTV
jgi:hypothetical protein